MEMLGLPFCALRSCCFRSEPTILQKGIAYSRLDEEGLPEL